MKLRLFFLFSFTLLSVKIILSQTYSFTFDGLSRSYVVHLPPGYSSSGQYPLVLSLHGLGMTAAMQEQYTKMNAVADTANFILVYPEGYNSGNGNGQGWNTGYWPALAGVNDLGFLSALIDTMLEKYSIDETRVFSCGMSQGASMSYNLACGLPQKIAAIAGATGTMSDSTALVCQNSCAVPVMHFHGTADPVIPYTGSYSGQYKFLSADSTVRRWVLNNSCANNPVVTNIPDINTADGCTVKKYDYGYGIDSSEVIFFKVINGGHTWPGSPVPGSLLGLGNTNKDVMASAEIWNFFKRHRLKCGVGTSSNSGYLPVENATVFPNPFSEQLTVNVTADVKKVSLLNLLGQKLYEKKVSSNEKVIGITTVNLGSGIYFLKMEKENQVTVTRLVKP